MENERRGKITQDGNVYKGRFSKHEGPQKTNTEGSAEVWQLIEGHAVYLPSNIALEGEQSRSEYAQKQLATFNRGRENQQRNSGALADIAFAPTFTESPGALFPSVANILPRKLTESTVFEWGKKAVRKIKEESAIFISVYIPPIA